MGGVGLSRRLVPGDLIESLELILTKADLGVFGSEEKIDLRENLGVFGREDGAELRSWELEDTSLEAGGAGPDILDVTWETMEDYVTAIKKYV